jgi:hypothetical protein
VCVHGAGERRKTSECRDRIIRSWPIQSFGRDRNIPGDIGAEWSDTSAGIDMTLAARVRSFYGWRVVGAAFVLAVFGLGAQKKPLALGTNHSIYVQRR